MEVVQDGKYESCAGCNLIPQLLEIMDELKGSIINLKTQISNLNERDDHNETENIIEEISDRKFRARNVIIGSIPESDFGNYGEQARKPSLQQRPLKVILESREQTLNVMRNKEKLREYDNHIKVELEETPMQKKFYEKVKADLDERRSDGEMNLYIRYVNNVLAVTETWLDPSTSGDFVVIPGYEFVRSDRPEGKASCSTIKKQLIREPTRITTTSQSMIDVCCVTNDLNIVDSGTMELDGLTDHQLIFCKMKLLLCEASAPV
ncbi:hypothetical protein WA026_020541 [Henosepilachna vigintioctopunctata]|uniref:Uncharacterized protein n=1 Tax=Henosepilachna vigintioctopunctata TaxID=420089 RepID=A0AAW1VA26_9CUCU